MSQNLQLTLGESPSGIVGFDLHLLLRTRLLLAASSGAGKSETIRKLCELCAGHVQIVVIDPEGEFAGMRATLPFVLAGPGGEAAATVKTAALLAHRLLELNASAVCDIYELPPTQRHEFVREFLTAMVDAPKALWHPVLVIVDEAHLFAPEKGETPSVASDAMADMAARGRKRGFCLVLATQRVSRLNNNVAALCENILVGRTTQIDQPRAAKMLNISGAVKVAEFSKAIGRVKDGQFFAWGRMFGLEEPTLFQVARPAGAMSSAKTLLAPPPAPAAIRDLLPQLASLPQEVEEKAEAEEELRASLRTANKRITELEKEVAKGGNVTGLSEHIAELEKQVARLPALEASAAESEALKVRLESISPLIANVATAVARLAEVCDNPLIVVSRHPILAPTQPRQATLHAIRPAGSNDTSLPAGERRVLAVLAQYPNGLQRTQISVFSGYTKRSTRDAYIQRLQTKGYVESNTIGITITSAGLGAVGDYEPLPTGKTLQEYWIAQLPKGEAEVLRVLCAKPSGLTREEIGAKTGYEAVSTRNAYIQRLAQKLLVDISGNSVQASDSLFD